MSQNNLYGVVEWLDENPILDGMKCFADKDKAFNHAEKQEALGLINGFGIKCTIIRLEKAM